MTKVTFQETQQGLEEAVVNIFESFGGGRAMLKSSKNVILKVNGVDFKPHVFTSPEVISAVVRYFYEQGAKKIYVIENCTQGNITRLVFEITGIKKMCQDTLATPVYLDETKAMPMYLPGLKSFIEISDFVHEHLILNSHENLYISIPKLKTHSMSTVTLGIKNQFGLVHQKSRIPDHNFNLHQKFADIYANIQPDFTLVDGLEATNFGHYPATAQASKCVIPMNLLFGGDDPLAVDIVGARLLGFNLEDVQHLRLSAEYGLGESQWEKIEIENKEIFENKKQNLSWDLLGLFPENVNIIRGKTRCCIEGCRRNTEAVLEVLGQDFNGQGDFSILMGKDADPTEVKKLSGPVHIAGDCAISDWYPQLRDRLGKRKVTCSPGCNNLAMTVDGLSKWMKVHPLKLVPISPLKSAGILLQSKLHGTKANIAPVFKLK